ncbi:hypothetical protein AGMMS49579_20070 [Spirochaetia bacterium]|nr:hypothetical protein AGMMS49579_20070 [Spirochaetia bacterium]
MNTLLHKTGTKGVPVFLISLLAVSLVLSCKGTPLARSAGNANVITVSTYKELQLALGFFFDKTDNDAFILQGFAVDGDVIKLAADLRAESNFGGAPADVVTGATVVVRKNVTIDGNGHTIDGNGYPVFDIDDTSAAIKNLTIKNGAYTAKVGGAMFVERDATLWLDNVTFDGNKAKSQGVGNGGGAIYLNPHGSTGRPKVIAANSKFINNSVVGGGAVNYYAGGAIFGNNAYISLSNCSFENNSATHGAAVSGSGTTKFNIADSTFTGNNTTVAGGAVLINHGAAVSGGRGGANPALIKVTATLKGNTFSNNSSGLGSGDVVLARYYPDDAAYLTLFPVTTPPKTALTDADKTEVLVISDTSIEDKTFADILRSAY